MVWKTNLYLFWIAGLTIGGKLKELEGLFTFENFMLKVFDNFDGFIPRASFEDPRDVFNIGLHLDEKHFPKHFFFANFQCLRCGLCCKNHDWIQVSPELVLIWYAEGRENVLKYVDKDSLKIIPDKWIGCNLCRRVNHKPYYYCRVNEDKELIFDCKVYICSKGIPVSHLDFKDIDELIGLIGLSAYYGLIEKDWNEDFDYSKCEYKTHKRLLTA